MNASFRRHITKNPANSKFYCHIRAIRGGKIVMDSAQGYERKAAAIREFDRLFSVSDIQLLQNDLQLALMQTTTKGKDAYIRYCANIVARMERLIDRSEEN